MGVDNRFRRFLHTPSFRLSSATKVSSRVRKGGKERGRGVTGGGGTGPSEQKLRKSCPLRTMHGISTKKSRGERNGTSQRKREQGSGNVDS